MTSVNKILSLDKDELTQADRELFIKDLRCVIGEYFESDGDINLEIARSEGGFIVCVLFNARRVKNIKKPQ